MQRSWFDSPDLRAKPLRRIGPLALVAAALLLAAAAPAPPAYDLVIRNGRVLDGTGSPWVKADVAVTGGRFVKIGKVEGAGAREIDAAGDYVTPGWIDLMDQSGGVLPRLVDFLDEAEFRRGVESKAPVDGVARRIPTRLVTHPDLVLVGMAAIGAAPMNYVLDYAGRGWG